MKILGAAALSWLDDARPLATLDYVSPAEPSTASPQFDLLFATAEAFRPHLGTAFLVRSESGAQATLRLAAVVELARTADIEQFSLRFHAPAATTELAGTRSFAHPVLGHFDMFIAAVGAPTGERVVYEACLSRRLSHG